VSLATADLALEFFRHPVVAHVVAGASGIAAHAGCGLFHFHALVGHAGDALETVSVGHAGLGPGKVAFAHHAAAHRLAHRVIRAGALLHGDHGPVSRSAHLEVLAAVGHAVGHHGTVGIGHAALHLGHVGIHDVLHHHGAFRVHRRVHVGGNQTDEESENGEDLHGG